jgi:hypothetical protein
MNDYAHSALEELAWTLNLLEETEDLWRIRRQLEGARDDMLAGVTVNLRQRLMTRKKMI